jgi:methyltransferase family protein
MNQGPADVFGKIHAEPNPLPADRETLLSLSWESNCKESALCVCATDDPEKVVSTCSTGTLEIDWIRAGRTYAFRLYKTSQPRRLLDEVKVSKKAVGKLTASPNPIPIEAGSKTKLHWQITSPAIGEIFVSENTADERLVCRGMSGSFEISGLRSGTTYLFRLYGGANRELLDELPVRLTDIPWELLLDRLGSSRGKDDSNRAAEFIAGLLPNLLHHEEFGDWFSLWESKGFHVTPVHFYEPIPDSRELSGKLWQQPLALAGVDMNEASQRRLLCEIFPTFQKEYQQIPLDSPGEKNRFYLANGHFEGLDPLLAYCLVRHFKPRKIIEVGSGYSTLILAEAARANGSTELHSIEPYPLEFLTQGVAGLASLLAKKVEEVDLSVFTELNPGDCLFIDTSHVVRIGGDVNFLFLEVLPRLKPGVIVHVHDIFFPFEYPKDWVIGRRRFWTEQYLLQAFLAFNAEFEVLVSSGYLKARFPEELKSVFPTGDPWSGGSFWMRRKRRLQDTSKTAEELYGNAKEMLPQR